MGHLDESRSYAEADCRQLTTLILPVTYRLDLPQVDLMSFYASDEVVRGREQRFLSCMAFSVYDVADSRGLSFVWLLSLRPVRRKKTGRNQTNHATDKPRRRLCKR